MPNQQLLDYINQQTRKGTPVGQIKQNLLAAGWQEADIDEALAGSGSASADAPQFPETAMQSSGKLPGTMDLAKQSWQIFKSKFWTLIGIQLLPAAIIIAAGAIIAVAIFSSGEKISMENFVDFLPAILIGVLVIGIAATFQFWGQIASLYVIKDRQEKIGVAESLRRSWPQVTSYWWIGILTGLATFGGILFFIIPGIILAILLGQSLYILIAENIKGMDALLKSKFYVKGRINEVFSRYFFFGLLMWLASLPFAIFKLDAAFQLLAAPLSLVYGFLVYENLKAVKAGAEYRPEGKNLILAAILFGIIAIPAFFFFAMGQIPNLGKILPPL